MLAWILGAIVAAGIGYTLHAMLAVIGFARRAPRAGAHEPVTLLKPLHGAEPRLAENLASFLDQDWAAPVQMVAGVADPRDPAAAIAATLGATVVTDAARIGSSAKISNLANMMPAAVNDLLVLSDSDMAVPRTYLSAVAGALAEPGVGVVTCCYRGRGDAGGWSVLAAAGLSYQFLPATLLARALGLAHPCMGSTIAMRRATLERIGGFAAFADRLADDYDIGAAVRALGLRIAMPPLLPVHGCQERSLAALWRHELRWAVTVRLVDPLGNLGMIVTYPVPIALGLAAAAPRAGAVLLLLAIAARLALKRAVDRTAGAVTAPAWMLPLRDCLSLAVYCVALFTRSVDWRGQRLAVSRSGQLAARPEYPVT